MMRNNSNRIRYRIFFLVQKLDLATIAFILIASVIGLFFVFKTPLLWGSDETSHVGRVYQLAHGTILSQEVHQGYSGYGFGGYVPSSLLDVVNYVNVDFNQNGPQKISDVRWVDAPRDYTRFAELSLKTPLVPYNFSNTAIYSPVPYIPAVIGFEIARAGNLTLGPTIFLGRVFDLVFYITITGAALFALRGYKIQWLLFAVGLFPTYIFQSSTINADAVTNTIAFALIVLLAKALLARVRLSTFETCLLLVCAFLMPITKPTYIFLSLLILLVPAKKMSLSKYGKAVSVTTVFAGLVLYGVWQFDTAYLSNASKWIIAGVVPWWQNINASAQLKYVIGHPLDFIKVLLRTVLITDNAYRDGIYGRLGFDYVIVPALTQELAGLCVVLGVLVSEKFVIPKKILVLFSAVALTSILAIFGTLYITICEVGQLSIWGVQGRYFMPILPLVLLIAIIVFKIRINDIGQKKIGVTMITLMSVGLLLAAAKFYYVTWG